MSEFGNKNNDLPALVRLRDELSQTANERRQHGLAGTWARGVDWSIASRWRAVAAIAMAGASVVVALSFTPPGRAIAEQIGELIGIGEVGGTPTEPYPHQARSGAPEHLSPAIVIGEGRTSEGRIEIVAYDSVNGLCIDVDHLGPTGTFGTSGCGVRPGNPPRGIAFGAMSGNEVGGDLSPDAASVIATVTGNGETRRVQGIAAVPDTETLRRLHHEPFGTYVVVIPGPCVQPHQVRVTAFDSTGLRLGSDRGLENPTYDSCGEPVVPMVPPPPSQP